MISGYSLAFGVGRLMGSVILFPCRRTVYVMSTCDVRQVFHRAAEECKESLLGGFALPFCVQVSHDVYRLLL